MKCIQGIQSKAVVICTRDDIRLFIMAYSVEPTLFLDFTLTKVVVQLSVLIESFKQKFLEGCLRMSDSDGAGFMTEKQAQ